MMSRLDDYFMTGLNGTDRVNNLKLGHVLDDANAWLQEATLTLLICMVIFPFWAFEKIACFVTRRP